MQVGDWEGALVKYKDDQAATAEVNRSLEPMKSRSASMFPALNIRAGLDNGISPSDTPSPRRGNVVFC